MANVGAMQGQVKALEAQLAAARMAAAGGAEPEGEYVLEEYEEEEYDENENGEVYVIEEYYDDGQEFDEEIIEIVEEYDDDEYEEVVEEEEEEVVDNRSPSAGGVAVSTVPKYLQQKQQPAATRELPKPAAAVLKPAAPRAAPSAPTSSGAVASAIDFSQIKLKKTGITLAEPEAEDPNKFTPPPKAHPAASSTGPPPRAVPARDAPQPGEKAHSFLAGVQQTDDQKAAAENKALQAVAGDENAPRKKFVPMKEKNPEKFPKNSLELKETPKKKTTTLVPLPFKQRAYPTIPASPSGQETPAEKILGSYLYLNVKMERVNVNAAMKDQEILLLYFGASWKAGCKAFHQPLIDFYKLTSKDCNLECVYVSADRTLFEFKDIYNKFPFLAMPSGTVEYKNNMTKLFQIADMPALVVLRLPTCEVVTLEGVEAVIGVPNRDRELSQKLVNEWRSQKPTAGGKTNTAQKPKEAAAGGATDASPPAAPATAAVAGNKTAAVGRKERKGLFSWKKR